MSKQTREHSQLCDRKTTFSREIGDSGYAMEIHQVSGTIHPPTLKPAISPSVHLSLTVVYTVLYSGLFFLVYIQLWLILCYRHRRFSYQTVFLFLCLVWSGLRTTLFSFYYINTTAANNLNTGLYWLLYCCPVALQYVTLCLMVSFFAGVYFRSLPPDVSKKNRTLLTAILVVFISAFLVTSVCCSIVLKRYDRASHNVPSYVSLVRVSVSGCLFLVTSAMLCVCIYRMSAVTATTVVLEAKGMTVKQAWLACIIIILLYTSRVLYNFVAISKPLSSVISFGYGWINVSDQADFENLEQGFAYVSFGVVLFVWEFLPTLIVVLVFRVQKPDDMSRRLSKLPADSYSSRAYFFDNPRRYDSDEDTPHSVRTGNDSIIEDEGPFTINSAGSYRIHTSPPQDSVYLPRTPPGVCTGTHTPSDGATRHNAPIITLNSPTVDSFYDGT